LPHAANNNHSNNHEKYGRDHNQQGDSLDQGEVQRLLAKQKLNELRNKARELLAQGKYRKAFDAYVEYSDSMSKVRGLAGAESAILEGARKFEELELWYEAGNLYLIVANFLSNMGVISDAGDFYLSAAEALEKVNDKSLRGFIATCYGAASQALRSEKSTAESDKALMKGVLAATGKNPLEVESIAYKSFRTHDLQGASEMFSKASSIYSLAIEELSDLAHNVDSGPLAVDVKSVLHHRAGQDLLASAACLVGIDKKTDAIWKKSISAADEFTKAVINFTPLFSLGEAHKVDYRRYSYDLMMGATVRSALGSLEDIEMLESQLLFIDKARTKGFEDSGYLSVAKTLMKTKKIKNVINDLKDVHLGSVDELKEQIIELLNRLEEANKKNHDH
jgi:tetratricopeptide (TPR) repeat protein